MNLFEYLEVLQSKATNNQLEDLPIKKVDLSDNVGFIEIQKQVNPQKWTARIIGNEKFLFYNDKYLNVTKFKTEINKLYSENGYTNFGFSKIPEEDLVRYKKIKDIIMPAFFDVMTDELDPEILAKLLYNNDYKERLENAGLICSGTSPDGSLVEIVEYRNHPYFIAGQFHPEFKSRPNRPAPLFVGLVKAAK